jgi:manganese transport protein
MLAVAAKLFHRGGHALVQTIQEAHAGFATEAGGAAALAFAVALLASGASSSGVGTYAGQVVMRGFVNLSIPVVLRRAVTMAPAIVVLAIGFNPTDALVLSQVLLSFGIPFALVPLILFTRDPTIMGPHVNQRSTTRIAVVFAMVITALNFLVLYRLLWA